MKMLPKYARVRQILRATIFALAEHLREIANKPPADLDWCDCFAADVRMAVEP